MEAVQTEPELFVEDFTSASQADSLPFNAPTTHREVMWEPAADRSQGRRDEHRTPDVVMIQSRRFPPFLMSRAA